ncbi:MAG: efflux RND transporter permease subunit, partial [Pseudomonadota bacterium]
GARKGYAESEDIGKAGWFARLIAFPIRMFVLVVRGVSFVLGFVGKVFTFVFGAINHVFASAYGPALRWAMRYRLIVCGASVALFIATMSLVPRLGSELIPQLSQGEFAVNLRLAPGTPLDETDDVVASAFSATKSISDIDRTFSVTGTGNRLDANPVDAGEHTAVLNITMAPGSNRAAEDAVIQRLRRSLDTIPGLAYDFERPALLALSTPLEVVYRGYNLDQLRERATALANELSANPQFADVRTNVEGGNPEIQITFDQERAASLGLVVRDIADSVVTSVRGNVATRYSWRDRKIDVTVKSVESQNASIDDVRQLIVNPGSARPVKLTDVADIRLATGPSEIRRFDQERVAVVSASLTSGDLGTVSKALEARLNEISLPEGMTVEVLGQSEEMERSLTSMQFTLALAIFLVYLVMASQFESLTHPFVILFTIPLAMVGAVLALWVTGTTVNVVAFIGMIMLAGIVVNNAIVMIDTINQLRNGGMPREAAIFEGARTRLRPILMTTLTTALGLLPMAIGLGQGAEVRTPMAITVIGGLLTSTLLTLIVIPVVYSLLDRKKTEADVRENTPGASRAPMMSTDGQPA